MGEACLVDVKRAPRMRCYMLEIFISSLALNLHEHDVCKEGIFAS